MCGIAGFTRDTPWQLQDQIIHAILNRGSQAASVLAPNEFSITIQNPEPEQFVRQFDLLQGLSNEVILIHSQAATSTPKWYETHPFRYREWFVAHNGVIHDWKYLFGIPWDELEFNYPYETDSSVIPYLLSEAGWDHPKENSGLQELNGTFACWAFNAIEMQTYLFRWVNPIYWGGTNAFSSEPFEGAKLIEEGVVYRWPQGDPIADFKPKEHPYK